MSSPGPPAATETASPAAKPDSQTSRLTPWEAHLLHRTTRTDISFGAGVLALAALTLWSGNAAARYLSPEGARGASALLDELELPRVLPNAPLTRDDGASTRLWDLTTAPRTIITFYAPWCKPCQEELPILVKGTEHHRDRLTVIVGADEDPAEVRKQLTNLGLADLRFHVDTTRELESGARVTALPTTFLVGRLGRVRERIVGYSQYRLHMLVSKAKGGMPEFEPQE